MIVSAFDEYWTDGADLDALRAAQFSNLFVMKVAADSARLASLSTSSSDRWTRQQLLHGLFPLSSYRVDPNHAATEAQVTDLRKNAVEESELFSEESAAAALRFCHDLAADHEPAIFLLVNGNLRATWRNEQRDQIGIQFMPNGLLQYVILRDRDGLTLKALGEDVSLERVRSVVEVQEMSGLWFRGQG